MLRTRPHLHMSIPPEVAALPRARLCLRAFLSLYVSDDDAVEDVVLCVQEAMKNSIRFSASKESIEVDVALLDHVVEARVRDFGTGFEVVPDVQALRLADPLSLSGRGLYLMRTLSDEFELVAEDGVEVRVVKKLGARLAAGLAASRWADPSGRDATLGRCRE